MDLNVTTPHTILVAATPLQAAPINPSGNTVILVPTPGPPGQRGPAGSAGGSVTTHNQTTPAATWTITHQLGRKPASVTIWLNDELVDTDIETPDDTTIVVTFATPQTGRAEIT